MVYDPPQPLNFSALLNKNIKSAVLMELTVYTAALVLRKHQDRGALSQHVLLIL